MTHQDPSIPDDHDVSDTSDRLYTPEELHAYAAAQRPPAPPVVQPDPLTDPMPGYPTGTRPVGPPPAAPPVSVPPVSVPPVSAPPASPPPAAPPVSPPPAAPPVSPPPPPPPVQAAAPAAPAAPPAVPPASPEPPADAEPDVRRFMSATDFLDRRDHELEHGPASWAGAAACAAGAAA